MPLPFDIVINGKSDKIIIPAEGLVVNSSFAPQIDPKGNYLKKITIH